MVRYHGVNHDIFLAFILMLSSRRQYALYHNRFRSVEYYFTDTPEVGYSYFFN